MAQSTNMSTAGKDSWLARHKVPYFPYSPDRYTNFTLNYKNRIRPFWGPYFCGKADDPTQIVYPCPSLPYGLISSPSFPQGYYSNTTKGHYSTCSDQEFNFSSSHPPYSTRQNNCRVSSSLTCNFNTL